MLSSAYMKAEQIRGEGDAQAVRIYGGAFGKDPGFYAFSRKLEVYKDTLGEGTQLVIGTDNELFDLLKHYKEIGNPKN